MQVYIYTGDVQINFYIYAIAFTFPKIHPGANYTYMYNLHTVCKSAHVNGALVTYPACHVRKMNKKSDALQSILHLKALHV